MLGAGVLVCLLAPSAASAALPPSGFYGANVQPVFEASPLFEGQAAWSPLFSAMAGDDLGTARMDVEWRWVEPSAPVNGVHTYDWSVPGKPQESLDQIVATLAASGIRMEATLDLPPGWAGASGTNLAPQHFADYEAFTAAFAARYGVGGSFWAANPQLPYLPVQQFEIWDEANSDNFWIYIANNAWTNADAAAYAQLLIPTSSAIHAVDPTAQVLPSIGWPGAAAYVTQLYADGVQGSIQGVAFHPYAPDAPSIVGLVEGVRAALTTAGDANIPIYATEVGLPASTPTTTELYSDPERAATLSLAGDALAHGDCGVDSYDIYSIVSSDTSATNNLGDGSYFGILDPTTFAPNITGQAIIAAEERWLSSPAGGLVECGSGTTPTQDLLPLGIQLTQTAPACASATVTYQGNPLESAELVLLASNNRVDPAATNTNGQAQMCVDNNGPNITKFTAYAEVSSPQTTASLTAPNIAMSATYTCSINAALSCAMTTPAPSGGLSSSGGSASAGGATPGSASTAAPNGYRLTAQLLKIKRARATLRARLLAPASAPATARIRVWLQRHGKHRRTLLTTVALSAGHWRTFAVKARLRIGDRVIVGVIADKPAGLVSLQTDLLATRRLGAR